MTSTEIQIPALDGSGYFSAYLTLPASGRGPGLVLAQEIFGVNETMRRLAKRYSEEGYVVLVPDLFWRQEPGVQLGYSPEDWQRAFALAQQFDEARGVEDIQAAVSALRSRPELSGGVGVLGYCLGGKLAYRAAYETDCDVAVGYYGVGIQKDLDEERKPRAPLTLHFAEKDAFCPPDARAAIYQALGNREGVKLYTYLGCDHAFAREGGDHYVKTAAELAHERSMVTLKAAIGPHYDLAALWEAHLAHEFGTRDVAATMATMVAEPYVNHIPTMTGGVGHEHLRHFYSNHFVHCNPEDAAMVLISRTIGATQLVDESVLTFTHSCEIPWMLPGIRPTGKRVEVPVLAVVKFRGDKLCHEHIYWDQASVLVQIGLLDPGTLPVIGVESAAKLLDERLESNRLITDAGSRGGVPR